MRYNSNSYGELLWDRDDWLYEGSDGGSYEGHINPKLVQGVKIVMDNPDVS